MFFISFFDISEISNVYKCIDFKYFELSSVCQKKKKERNDKKSSFLILLIISFIEFINSQLCWMLLPLFMFQVLKGF